MVFIIKVGTKIFRILKKVKHILNEIDYLIVDKDEVLDLIEKEGNFKKWIYTCQYGIEYKCIIIRNPIMNFLCGYVEVDKYNQFFGNNDYLNYRLDVHGGITYASEHLPNLNGNSWFIGFDCGHYGDLVIHKNMNVNFGLDNGIYRDMNYVKDQCEKLADQLSQYHISVKRLNKIKTIEKD